MDCIASGDESSRPDQDGRWLYAMAFPIVRVDRTDAVRAGLRALLPAGANYLHFYDLPAKARIATAHGVAELDWEAALVVVRATTNRRQEAARARILASALPRLEHVEGVRDVLLESRARADRHDIRTRSRLLGSRRISSTLRIRHADKRDELTWLADFVVGAFLAGVTHGEREPWRLLDQARPLEVTWLPQDRPR